MRQVKARRGFTLLELIVATSILAVAVVGLMSGITGSTRNAAWLRDSDRIAMAARERMNELLADYSLPRDTPVSASFDSALLGGIEAGWRAQLSTAERPASASGQLALDRIRLEVWWNRNGNRRAIELEGFRKRYLLKGEGGGPQ
jgi:general secretion pathway protein I